MSEPGSFHGIVDRHLDRGIHAAVRHPSAAAMYVSDMPRALFYFSVVFFFFNHPATTEISPLSLHDALPISLRRAPPPRLRRAQRAPRGLTRITPGGSRSEEHTSELQSRVDISYAVFCF